VAFGAAVALSDARDGHVWNLINLLT
jgi:hypothetical protein